MEKDNSKVPVAILSCFLIAFILQGVLKMCGIFVFEKALSWEIFKLIDSSLFLQIIYYTLMTSVCVYCLCFALTTKWYSKKWYHYVAIFGICLINTIVKLNFTISFVGHMLFDILLYILLPLFVNITTNAKDKLLKKSLFDIVLLITLQISLYFYYLGLGYWSSLLSSYLPQIPTLLSASTNFLIRLEMYIGVVMIMLSMNMIIRKIKEVNMHIPMDIASDEAKIKELEELEAKKAEKKEEE